MWYRFVQLLFSILFRIIYRLRVIGRENIPRKGPVVIACNHVSLLDPPMVGTASSRPVHFMAKSELFVPVLGTCTKAWGPFRSTGRRGCPCHPDSAHHPEASGSAGDLSGRAPEPGRETGESPAGALAIALKGKAEVVPACILGSDLKHRKSFWPRITVVFGKPMKLENEQGNKLKVEELSEELMREIQALMDAHSEN